MLLPFHQPFLPTATTTKSCQLIDPLTGYTSKKFISVFYIQENLEAIFKFKQEERTMKSEQYFPSGFAPLAYLK